MGFFDKLKNGLTKTRESIAKQVNNVFSVFIKVDDELFENLEEALIMADIGVETSTYIIEKLRDNVKHKHITDGNLVKEELKSIISEILSTLDTTVDTSTTPSVILVIGVNGVGKTTSIGKIASHYKSMGKKVLLAAADTFRAAAIDQLDIWAQRSGCDIIKKTVIRRQLCLTLVRRQRRVVLIFLYVIQPADFIIRKILWRSLRRLTV